MCRIPGEGGIRCSRHLYVQSQGVTASTGRGADDPAWRAWKLENLRRSLAMLSRDQLAGLRRDEAIELIEELQKVQGRLRRIHSMLWRLLEDGG